MQQDLLQVLDESPDTVLQCHNPLKQPKELFLRYICKNFWSNSIFAWLTLNADKEKPTQFGLTFIYFSKTLEEFGR